MCFIHCAYSFVKIKICKKLKKTKNLKNNNSQKNDLSTFFLPVEVVFGNIKTKTAVDNRRHGTLVNYEVKMKVNL